MHEHQFRKELELRSDQTRTVQENILPDCLTVDRSNEGLSAGASDHPEERKDTQSDQSQDTNQEYVLLTQLVRSGLHMLKPRKMIEICTYTMNMSKAAQQSKTGSWIALTPISIETGFDLLTVMGRLKAENYLRREKPDLIIGEWMCGPFSQFQNINMAKGPEWMTKILELRKAHMKVSAWIARQERWQRLENKGHWIGEQPARCGSWNLKCLQEMQEENYNTYFDMCSVGLTCPKTEFLMRKRTKLNHTSSILHEFFEEFRQCSQDHQHQQIEGHTRYINENGEWRTISRGVFAGWYTPQFCSDVIACFEEEFARQDDVLKAKKARRVHFCLAPDVAAVHTSGATKSTKVRGA